MADHNTLSNHIWDTEVQKEKTEKAFSSFMNPPIIESDPYWDRISNMAKSQRNKGIAEYGKGIEEDTADILVRLTRIEEELIDALYYIEHLRDKIGGES